MGSAGNVALTAARSRRAIRRWLATTPGRMQLAAAMLATGALVFGIVAAHAASERRHAVDGVESTEPLLASAVNLSASLSKAHAIAAFSFLVGGVEPASSHREYVDELNRATLRLASLAGEVGASSASRPAVRSITERLPVYSGFVGNARANYRQGFPVGSAYLRRASREMNEQMLPRARDLYRTEARTLIASYRAGVSARHVALVILAGGAMLALLAVTQVHLARATRRIVNVPLALGSVVMLAIVVWIVLAFAAQQRHLARAQHDGSNPVELLTAVRIQASRAQANESIALAARGGGVGEERVTELDRGFRALVAPIGSARAATARGGGGLLAQAVSKTGHPAGGVERVHDAYRVYRAAHGRVVRRELAGQFTRAVELATAPDLTSSKRAADRLNEVLDRQISAAQSRFGAEISRAASPLDELGAGISVLTALAALLALFGIRQRLEEYR
ncbi:MAG TPA: hypothetical protein VGO80_08830 [Solirubrobacteraceae bacterium]|jgi:hypothetical protein|nr:hypothetical protein [Solirubrobacteraceae bacterium]